MEFSEVVRSRYACKKYSDRPVEAEKLNAVLEAGRLAPTAKNLQEQRIYVLQGEALALADQVTPCRYGAGTVLAVAYDKNNVYTYPDGSHSSGTEDAVIVATHMMLAAADEGLNSCWINNFRAVDLEKILGLPENEELVMMLDLGYAAEGAGPLPNHSLRKPLEDTVTYVRA